MNTLWTRCLCTATLIILMIASVAFAGSKPFVFGGGPKGGTFQYFADAIATRMSQKIPGVEVVSERTGGSAENLNRLHKGDIDFGIVYAGDLWLFAKMLIPRNPEKYDKVLPMAFLYGSPAQLVVLRSSTINSVEDLIGKKVAIGNPGSGAGLSAQRCFEAFGLWNKILARFIGYSDAASALVDGQIDAFWVLTGYPNDAIVEADNRNAIKLLALEKVAARSRLYDKYPFYSPAVIPAGTYKGVDQPIGSFKDSALWCTRKGINDNIVKQALETVFSEQGLAQMRQAHEAAREMSVKTGISGIPLPLAKAAMAFWKEKGIAH